MSPRVSTAAAAVALGLVAPAAVLVDVSWPVVLCVVAAVVTVAPGVLTVAATVRAERRSNAVLGGAWEAELARRTRRSGTQRAQADSGARR